MYNHSRYMFTMTHLMYQVIDPIHVQNESILNRYIKKKQNPIRRLLYQSPLIQ